MPDHYTIAHSSTDREQWLEARRSGIGASDVPILLGLTTYGSNLSIYAQKCGDEPDPEAIEETEPMRWGKLFEPAIREELARRASLGDVQVIPEYTVLRSTRYPWLCCTPDGLTAAGEPVEVKNIGHGYHEDEWDEGIPAKWHAQVQAQLLVTGAKRACFGACLFGQRLVWEWIESDEITQRSIIAITQALWERIERRDPPPSDGMPDARRVAFAMADVRQPVTLLEDRESMNLWETLRERERGFRDQLKHAERARRAVEDSLVISMGAARSAVCGGYSLTRSTVERRGYTVAPSTYEQLKIKEAK